MTALQSSQRYQYTSKYKVQLYSTFYCLIPAESLNVDATNGRDIFINPLQCSGVRQLHLKW